MKNVKDEIINGELHLVKLLGESVIICTKESIIASRFKIVGYSVHGERKNPVLEIKGYDEEGMNKSYIVNELAGIIL